MGETKCSECGGIGIIAVKAYGWGRGWHTRNKRCPVCRPRKKREPSTPATEKGK